MDRNSLIAKRLSEVMNMPAPQRSVVLPLSSELDRYYARDSSRERDSSRSSSGGRPPPPHQVLCTFYRRGVCSKGGQCRFIHERSNTTTKYKTEMCKHYQYGNCEYKDKCSFAHGRNELRIDEKH